MVNPVKISVLMPVYNAESYLREAIDSILAQTFDDFELIIIDDGSTDQSVLIVNSYDDRRVKLFTKVANEGIVETLNKGISLCSGEYIARMDADDVSLPRRLELQQQYLDMHPDVAMVAVKAAFINHLGVESGSWPQDRSTTSYEQIRRLLPKTNCIVHPSVMIRGTIARTYRYSKNQRTTEDYDLWLRLAADNHKIEKIDEILIKYRVHKDSITSKSNSGVGHYKEVMARFKFLITAVKNIRQLTAFHFAVLCNMVVDFFGITRNYAKVLFLAAAREVFISLGKPFGAIYQKYSFLHHEVLLFVSFSPNQIGGAERVHTDLISCNLHRSPWAILANEWNQESIRPAADVAYKFSNISSLLRNPFTKNLAIGFFAGYLNRSKSVAFGGNCEFYYWLVPYLDPEILCVDFIHGFGCLIEIISIPHIPRINRRIVIAEELRHDLAMLYSEYGIAARYLERICMVNYGVEVPQAFQRNEVKPELCVIYVGRGTIEKRVHLVGRIARLLAERNVTANVTLIGNVRDSVAAEDREYCTFCGPIDDRAKLDDFYKKADILVITSSTEGLSLVRMEAMARGVVPVVVDVGPLPGHIQHGVTGFLVSSDQTEDKIVQDFCQTIETLVNDRQLLKNVSANTYEFACRNFDRAATLHSFSRLFDVTVTGNV